MGWFCFGLGVGPKEVETVTTEPPPRWLCEGWFCLWLGYDDQAAEVVDAESTDW